MYPAKVRIFRQIVPSRRPNNVQKDHYSLSLIELFPLYVVASAQRLRSDEIWNKPAFVRYGRTAKDRMRRRRGRTRDCGAKALRGPKPPPAEACYIYWCALPRRRLTSFSCSFFRRKRQRRPRGENGRETNSVSLKRAPAAGLRHIRAVSAVAARQSPQTASALACGRRLHDRSGRSVCGSFCFRHFHIAAAGRPAAC